MFSFAARRPAVLCAATLHALAALPAAAQCVGGSVISPDSRLLRFGAAMAYHPGEARVLLHGGRAQWRAGSLDYRDEGFSSTLAWDGSRWTPLTPSGPLGGDGPVMAFDAARNQMILIGPAPGTFAWNGSSWLPLTGGDTLPPRRFAGIVYHPSRQAVLVFGGQALDLSTPLNDLWQWNGSTWTQLSIPGGPEPYFAPRMAYDAARNRLVVLCGKEHWELDGTTWIRRPDVLSFVRGMFVAGVFYDPAIRSVVMIAADAPNAAFLSVKRLTETGWIGDLRTTPPFGARLTSAAFDERLGSILAVGGHCGSYCTIDTVSQHGAPGVPSFTSQPSSVRSCAIGDVALSVRTQFVSSPAHQWRKRTPAGFVDIADGLTPSGATIIGSTSSTLRILRASPGEAGDYLCLVTGPCGTRTSLPATISVCTADFTCDGTVDFFDYLTFVDLFSQDDPDADINRNNTVDFFDYLDFTAAFEQGCP